MTKYYDYTIKAVRDFLQELKAATNDDAYQRTLKWIEGIEQAVASKNGKAFADLIQELQDAKNALKEQKEGIRARRLGLRIAGINPRGPYGVPLFDKGSNSYVKKYQTAAAVLGDRVSDILAAIRGPSSADKSAVKATKADLDTLITKYGATLASAKAPALQQLLVDMNNFIASGRGPDRVDGDIVDSSYWPSVFVASSSSSSTLPPP
jgi:hypothetical protein